MATSGWWGQYAANPTSQPYAGYLSYLDYVIPASTQLVTSPTITPEGVVRDESTGAGGGSAVEGSATSSPGLTVGEAATSSTSHPTGIPGLSLPGMIPGLPAAIEGGTRVAQGLTLAGLLDPAMVAGVPLAGTLFSATNALSGFLSGFNIDPTTGLTVGGKDFQGLMADPMFASFIDFSAPAISPFASATIGPMGANQPGFSTSPFALGTPFSANPPTVPSQTNFGQARSGGADAEGTSDPGGASPAPGSSDAAPGSTASDSGAMRRGGPVRDTQPGGGDNERRRLTAGEYVVRHPASTKYRTLLDAINRGAYPKVVARVAGKLARRMAA